MMEHRRAGWRELHDPIALVFGQVGVEPPAERAVELLGAVHVGDRQNDDLQPELAGSDRFGPTHLGLQSAGRARKGRMRGGGLPGLRRWDAVLLGSFARRGSAVRVPACAVTLLAG